MHQSALFLCACERVDEVEVRRLLTTIGNEAGGEKAISCIINTRGNNTNGMTILHTAVMRSKDLSLTAAMRSSADAIVEMLILAGGDLNSIADSGETPFTLEL